MQECDQVWKGLDLQAVYRQAREVSLNPGERAALREHQEHHDCHSRPCLFERQVGCQHNGCQARPGSPCKRPSGHACTPHGARKSLAWAASNPEYARAIEHTCSSCGARPDYFCERDGEAHPYTPCPERAA